MVYSILKEKANSYKIHMTGGAQLVLLDIDYEMIHHHNLEHMVYQEDQVWEFLAHFRLQIQMVCLVDLFF